MKIESKAVHWGDRKKPGAYIPVTTPIYTASSYAYDSMEQLDRVFEMQEEGPSYARYDNPTRSALEEVMRELESGAGAIACASGMAAIHTAVLAALLDRPKRVLAANMMYGATTALLMKIFDPMGVETTQVDPCDLPAFEAALTEVKFGAVIVETIANPLLRVPALDKIAALCRKADVPLIVDNTFATPLLVRPLELGASIVCHSVTKYLAGHGDVLGGVIISDAANFDTIRTLSRTIGPVLGPFESYLTMRGIKTLAVRFERQCSNAIQVARWLAQHPRVERVYFPGDPQHADAEAIQRLFPKDRFSGLVAFGIKDADRAKVFRFMERLQMVVRATSLGDVHTMILYPAMASHRDLSPKHRQRLGIHENLVRMSIGIEAIEDILADLDQALGK
ncbi:MAG: aminotransferase class I/II-fold pyridoxal phosphate-dependent enzyme [Acidobacteriota bacterium]